MRTEIDVSMTYVLGAQRLALLALEVARDAGQRVVAETLEVENAVVADVPGAYDVGRRSWVRTDGDVMRLRYRAQVEVSRPPVHIDGLSAAALDGLPAEVITFLRPSRYCQSDLIEGFAARSFGHLEGGAKVAAILDMIAAEMEYAPGHTDATTTLIETFETRKGVCRDYAHMFCGLARAAHIPARYVSAYGAAVDPPDFHAVAEVWLDNDWHLVDPSGMCMAEDLVVIGVGRDAADVPFMETPDEARFMCQNVRVTRQA